MLDVMKKTVETKNAEALRAAGTNCLPDLSCAQLICLTGELGSGKTTFAQGLLAALGAKKPFTSPTFTIVKSYDVNTVVCNRVITKVHHMDAYRISEKDLPTIGWDEMIADSQALVILEWPERIANALPEEKTTVCFQFKDGTARQIVFM